MKIQVDVAQPTKEILLNSHDLTLKSASVTASLNKTDLSQDVANIAYDKESQRSTLSFGTEVPVSTNVQLTIEFEGTINNARLLSSNT